MEETPMWQQDSTYRLCYVEDSAWFTTANNLQGMHTDDWDDDPWAGPPYEHEDYDLLKLKFDGPIVRAASQPPDRVNQGAQPWLRSESLADRTVKIHAGVSVWEFVERVRRAGGEVYFPATWLEDAISRMEDAVPCIRGEADEVELDGDAQDIAEGLRRQAALLEEFLEDRYYE